MVFNQSDSSINLSYLEDLLPISSDWVQALETYAHEHKIPIMEPLGIHFLIQLLRVKQPNRILEIGAAIGYSALRMADAVPNASILTIERDEDRYHEAQSNFSKYDKNKQISIILGDALEIYEKLVDEAPFDVLFIDAAKGQYQRFFELYAPLLSQNGVIISDNVLFKGLVADRNQNDNNQHRLVNKIRSFNDWLVRQSGYDTSIIPIGDGVAVTTKRAINKEK